MLKKIVLTAFAMTIILGGAITAISKADSNPESIIVKETQETQANPISTDIPLSDIPLNTVDSVESRIAKAGGVGEIYTHYGKFAKVSEQTIFKESGIARKLDQIGPNTNQLILECGIFLRED